MICLKEPHSIRMQLLYMIMIIIYNILMVLKSVLLIKGICMIRPLLVFSALTLLVGAPLLAQAETVQTITIHDKQFDPRETSIPTDTKVKLIIKNQDSFPVEFESRELSREVIVPAHGEISVFVGPLENGRYPFFNDFNHNMTGTIVAAPEKK